MWSHSRALCWKQVYVVIEFVLQSRSQPDCVRHKLYLQSLVRLRHHHNTKRGSMVFIPADHLQNLGQYVLKQVEAVRAAPCETLILPLICFANDLVTKLANAPLHSLLFSSCGVDRVNARCYLQSFSN